jgi:hypothetical protein
MTERTQSLAHTYFRIKSELLSSSYFREIIFEDQKTPLHRFTEQEFLKEAAWVILNGGMKENVIRGLFDKISQAFMNWESAFLINELRDTCFQRAIRVFGHSGKIGAICDIATILDKQGINRFQAKIAEDGLDFLSTLPYLGQVTSRHLLKNLGFDLVKPDRHLLRISEHMGYSSPEEMCFELSELIDEKVSVIDIVFWRFANSNRDYISQFN